jgi:hypothetical protein
MMVQTNTPYPITQYNFLAFVPLLLACSAIALREVESPCRFLKDDGNAESDGFSPGSGDGEMQREKIYIWASCLFPSAFFLLSSAF